MKLLKAALYARISTHDQQTLPLQQKAKRDYAKKRLKALDMTGKGKIRVNNAGCLDRCEEGPVIVIYPEGVWYTYVDRHDVDEIIERHLLRGETVERLKI